MPINKNNLVCIIPTCEQGDLLHICLSSFYKHTSNPPKIIIIDRNSQDNTNTIVSKYSTIYDIDFVSLPKMEHIWLQYTDSLKVFFEQYCQKEYILSIHPYVEFLNYNFWDTINQSENCDITYVGYQESASFVQLDTSTTCCLIPNIKNIFTIYKFDFIKDALYHGIEFESKHDFIGKTEKGSKLSIMQDQMSYLFDWALNNFKTVKQIRLNGLINGG